MTSSLIKAHANVVDTNNIIKKIYAEISNLQEAGAISTGIEPAHKRFSLCLKTTKTADDKSFETQRWPAYVPMIDLALDHLMQTAGLEYLDPKFFPGRSLLQEK